MAGPTLPSATARDRGADAGRCRAVAHRPRSPHRWRGRALPAARSARRGRAALRDRGRARRDDRGAAARPAPDAGHHGARHRGADAGPRRARARCGSKLAYGERRPPGDVARALERMGYRRVPTVTEVAEFSVRGGIVDVYGFGMAAPARLEWWGDDVSSIRGFDLTTQRSVQRADRDHRAAGSHAMRYGRTVGRSKAPASPSDAPRSAPRRTRSSSKRHRVPITTRCERAWREAEHHLDVARRLGEDVPVRGRHPRGARGLAPPGSAAFPRLLLRDERVDLQVGFFPPERVDRDLNRLRGPARGRSADAHPLRQRRASSSGSTSCSRKVAERRPTRRSRSARWTAAS